MVPKWSVLRDPIAEKLVSLLNERGGSSFDLSLLMKCHLEMSASFGSLHTYTNLHVEEGDDSEVGNKL